jgi:hypothetical protein
MIKRLMSKKANLFGKQIPVFVIALIAVIGFASATVYVVNTLTLTVGVKEAFTVQYAVIGDGGTYITGNCADVAGQYWFDSNSQNIPTGGFYPLESRKVCIRINNLGEAAIPYTIKSNVTNDNANQDCAKAFGLPKTLTGSAVAKGFTYDGAIVQIAADATPVEGCNVVISVGRGTA